jgi:hypothetical protein
VTARPFWGPVARNGATIAPLRGGERAGPFQPPPDHDENDLRPRIFDER